MIVIMHGSPTSVDKQIDKFIIHALNLLAVESVLPQYCCTPFMKSYSKRLNGKFAAHEFIPTVLPIQ